MTITFARPRVPAWVAQLGTITATDPVEIPIAGSPNPAIVDSADLNRLTPFAWHLCGGYAKTRCTVNGRRLYIYMHRLVLGAESGTQVDHINRDRLDNRRSNLRLASHVQQCGNVGMSRNNTSGFKGVHQARSGRWVARIGIDHRNVCLGTFDDPAEAARAYDSAARERFGEFACTNFPPDNNPLTEGTTP